MSKENDASGEKYPDILDYELLTFYHFCRPFNDVMLSPLRFIEALSKQLANRCHLTPDNNNNNNNNNDFCIIFHLDYVSPQ